MPRQAKQFIPWSQRQLLPSEEELRKQAARRLNKLTKDAWLEDAEASIVAIPIPNTTRVQWYWNHYDLTNITPTIHALLYGKQLKSAPLHPGRSDTWHRGLSLANQVNFRNTEVAGWWEQELAACARTVGVDLRVRVQVVRLDQGGE